MAGELTIPRRIAKALRCGENASRALRECLEWIVQNCGIFEGKEIGPKAALSAVARRTKAHVRRSADGLLATKEFPWAAQSLQQFR
jgi:hypothetical protein